MISEVAFPLLVLKYINYINYLMKRVIINIL